MHTGDPTTDLVTAAAKHGTQAVATAAEKIASGAVDGYRERVRMRFAVGTWEAAVKGYTRACKIATDAGLPVSAVPVKQLFPILDGMALEEDPDLSEAWSTLLANAATGNGSSAAMFADMLKQLEPIEAKILNGVHDTVITLAPDLRYTAGVRRQDIQARHSLSDEDFNVAADALMRHRLVAAPRTWGGIQNEYATLTITVLGTRFVRACRPPGVVDPAPTILDREQWDAVIKRQTELPDGAVPDDGSFYPDLIGPEAIDGGNAAGDDGTASDIAYLSSRLDGLELERDLLEQDIANDARGA